MWDIYASVAGLCRYFSTYFPVRMRKLCVYPTYSAAPAAMHNEIYLDSNATTYVLPAAIVAATEMRGQRLGTPSSTHATGLQARALLDQPRQRARRLLGVGTGRLMFTSGATEGIQTAVLSAL